VTSATAVVLTGYAGTAAALAGLGIGIARWPALERGQRAATVFLGTSALCDLAAYAAAYFRHNTQSVARVWFLLSVVLGLEILAAYQRNRRQAALFRLIAGGYVLTWLILGVTVDPIDNYSTFTGPLQGIVILAAAATTLFQRVALGRRDFLSDPGFMIAVALCAVAVPAAFQTVVAQLWLNDHRDMGNSYYVMNNMVDALAALLIIGALRIPDVRAVAQAA